VGCLAVFASAGGPADPEPVRRMLTAAPHRGDALELVHIGTAALGVANQPGFVDSWVAEDHGLIAAFSGTFDNGSDLCAELARAGAPLPRGDSPAATLIALFRRDPDRIPSALRGNFAGAVSDGTRTWLFRDHFGFRTLYHRSDDAGFWAASEAKQVVAGAGLPREPDVEAVSLAFWDGLDEGRITIKGAQRFPRATVCVTDGHRDRFTRYWDPTPLLETARLSIDEACERLDELLGQAIARTVTGRDVVLLSGGVDSPAVAAYAAEPHLRRGGRPLAALSRLYPDHPTVDEERYIRLVSARLGLDLHTYTSDLPALADTERWVDLLDGPSNVLLLPEVASSYERARALGARTVMTGELAEYVFTQDHHLIGHLLLHGRARAVGRWVRERRARGRPWRVVAREMAASVTPGPIALRYLRWRDDDVVLAPWIDQTGGVRRHDLSIPARRRWSHGQLVPYTGAAVSIEAADLCAAVCGVHERKPLADVELWEFLLSLRAEVKFPDSTWKSLLRRTLRGRVPDEILDRRDKTAFDAALLDTADYAGLERCIVRSEQRIAGIDYRVLEERIARREMSAFELLWAYDLARAHAFLDLWA
jgi:asparagine synthase (glutamine-hydrolysing)